MVNIKEAIYYQKKKDEKVLCNLCPHHCVIPAGSSGICQARVNKNGVLYSENYGMISSLAVDPIEKKPIYHFYPGSKILSIGTFGCNFSCDYCQNWQISQLKPSLQKINPEEVIKIAREKGSIGIAYTYSEPSIWYEYIMETAEKAKNEGLKNVMVSNAYISTEALKELIPYLDAVNIDIKSFNNDFYHKYCSANLAPVLDNIELLVKKAVHLELTTLIITDLNDSIEEIKDLLFWVEKLSPDIPIHFSRYFPAYKLDKPQTSIEKMKEVYQIAKEYLNYVYLGNVHLEKGNNTICPECAYLLIKRDYYGVDNNISETGRCPECGHKITGYF